MSRVAGGDLLLGNIEKEALRTIAAYIDLNPVRAGLVDDLKDYRWCGYAEALGGSKRARRGGCLILGVAVVTWESKALETYRRLFLGEGIEASEEVKESEARDESGGGFGGAAGREGFEQSGFAAM